MLIIRKTAIFIAILFSGLTIFIVGIVINHVAGMKGELILQSGKSSLLSVVNGPDSIAEEDRSDLGLVLTLDSMTIHPYTPQYSIELRKLDTSMIKDIPLIGIPPNKVVSRFSLEKMKIRKVEKTEFRFRLKEFYPDFSFSYSYPEKRDTIPPRAPGILLELKTKEGTQVVTLQSDHQNRNTLMDLFGLGASLTFYWEIPQDSMQSLTNYQTAGKNAIIFSGAKNSIYFFFEGKIAEQSLIEKTFYKIPGKDSVGFTIIHCFPDIVHLKAVPSTKGNEPIHPVANVEIWKTGHGALEAFLYPETNGSKSGEFMIPGSDYILGLGLSDEYALKYCDCTIKIKNHDDQKSLGLISGKGALYHGFRYKPMLCRPGLPNEVTLQVTHYPGTIAIYLGLFLSFSAILLMWLKQRKESLLN